MEETLTRFWENLINRPSGPFALRFILQPCMATILAIRSGIRDEKEERPPFLWSIKTDPQHHGALLRDAWKDITKVFILAIVLDVAYQIAIFRRIFPLEALFVAFLLAIVPYAVVRGPVRRLASRSHKAGSRH